MLLRGLYLWNRKPDWQAVCFGGYPHPFYRVWDQCRIMPVPTVARGACYLGDVTNVPPAVSRWRLGRLRWNLACSWRRISYSLCSNHGWDISARAHVQRYPHTALLYLRNGSTDCVQIWYVGWVSLAKCLPQVIGGVHLHVRTCAPLSHKCSACRHSETVGPIALKFGMHWETD